MVLTSLFPDDDRRSFPDEERPSFTAANARLTREEGVQYWGRNLREFWTNQGAGKARQTAGKSPPNKVIDQRKRDQENVTKENVTTP